MSSILFSRLCFALSLLLVISSQVAPAATYTYTNGENNTSPLTITGTAIFTIASGTATQSGEVADSPKATSITKTGTGTLIFSNKINFAGSLSVRDGRFVSSGPGSVLEYLGVDYPSGAMVPAFEVTGGSASIYTIYVGSYQSGAVRVSNGGLLINRNSADFGRSTGTGSLTVSGSGSEFRSTGGHDLALGQTGVGVVTVNNGGKISSTLGNRRLLFAEGAQGRGTLNVGGASGSAAEAPGTVNFARIATGGGAGQIVFNHTGTNYVFSQDATSTGANILIEGRTQVRSESGVTTLKGANTYTGGTAIFGGTFLVSDVGASSSVLGTGAVDIRHAGTLGGVGRVGGATTVSGTVAPGNSPGLLTFAQGLTLNSDATVVMEIGGFNRGTQYDAIDVNGAFSLGGELRIVFINGFSPQVGDSFDLFGGAFTSSSSFSRITFSMPAQGSFDPATGFLTVTSLVPEPSSLSLLLPLLGLALRRRRREPSVNPLRENTSPVR